MLMVSRSAEQVRVEPTPKRGAGDEGGPSYPLLVLAALCLRPRKTWDFRMTTQEVSQTENPRPGSTEAFFLGS